MNIDQVLVVKRPVGKEYNTVQKSFTESLLKISGITETTFSTVVPGEKNGWVLGSGYYVLDEREGDNENFKKLPGYVRIDAMAAYRFKLGKAPLALQFNVQNLFNEQYIEATDNGTNAYPGAPRLFIGSIKVDL